MDTKSKSRLNRSIVFLLAFCITAVITSVLITRYICSYYTEFYYDVHGGGVLYRGIAIASILFAVFLALYCGEGGLMTTGLVSRAPEWSLVGFAACVFLGRPLVVKSGLLAYIGEVFSIVVTAAAWASIAFVLIWSTLLLMRVFRKDLRRDFIEKSVLVKLFAQILRLAGWLERILMRVGKFLLPGVFIFIGLYVIACFNYRAGLLLLLLFLLAALYYVLSRIQMRALNGYGAIMNLTDQMAKGNLDVSLDEDLDLFDPIKENVLHIRDGLQKALEEERKSQNMRTELITNVSHDLRTPLTAIITYIDILKGPDLPEEERARCMEVLDKKSGRLKTLIDDLFEVSKASSNSIVMEPEEMDFVKFVRQYQVETEDRLEGSGLDFRFRLPDAALPVCLDGQRTCRVLDNLTGNAIKYSATGSRVYVEVSRSGNHAKFVIKNISAGELNFDPEEITERFIRGDLSRNTEGSGLGLAIVKSFVENQGGLFRIEIDGDLFKAIILWPLIGEA